MKPITFILPFPKCRGKTKVMRLNPDAKITKTILKHLQLWDLKVRDALMANAPLQKQ